MFFFPRIAKPYFFIMLSARYRSCVSDLFHLYFLLFIPLQVWQEVALLWLLILKLCTKIVSYYSVCVTGWNLLMYIEHRLAFLSWGSSSFSSFSFVCVPHVVTSDALLSGLNFPPFTSYTRSYMTSHRCRYLDYEGRTIFRYRATMSKARCVLREWNASCFVFIEAAVLIKRLKSCIPRVSGSSSLCSSRHNAAAAGIPGMCAASLVSSGRARYCEKLCVSFLSRLRREVCVVKIRNRRRGGNYHTAVMCSMLLMISYKTKIARESQYSNSVRIRFTVAEVKQKTCL